MSGSTNPTFTVGMLPPVERWVLPSGQPTNEFYRLIQQIFRNAGGGSSSGGGSGGPTPSLTALYQMVQLLQTDVNTLENFQSTATSELADDGAAILALQQAVAALQTLVNQLIHQPTTFFNIITEGGITQGTAALLQPGVNKVIGTALANFLRIDSSGTDLFTDAGSPVPLIFDSPLPGIGGGVVLPDVPTSVGDPVEVLCFTTRGLYVFPPTGGQINTLGANVPAILIPSGAARYIPSSEPMQWYVGA